ncbi:MAG: hypothetical protein LCI00_23195 [Chloroflexi bacterium]|nr:hypothetical protein [Chloroflexota bacterium]MCC6895960.1 hypothetical protein [Anaerolineae bacterium]
MLISTLNAIFATAAFFLVQRALQRGIPFIKMGWMAIKAQTSHPDFRENVFRRLAISEGGRFLLGGLGWLLTAVIALIAGIYFTVIAYQGFFMGG